MATDLAKTIIFARNHAHATFIEERFNLHYPRYAGHFARIIDHYAAYPQSLLDDFAQKDKAPHIAISVDMLDTGIDVPEVANLVFFKPVYSRIKFWQMIGRGTRLCPDLFGPGHDKHDFRVFDFCFNFDFFREHPEGIEVSGDVPLRARLFRSRVQLLAVVQATPDLDCLGAQLAISVNNCPPPRDPEVPHDEFQAHPAKYVQKAYRVRNWREYETGLRARGSLTVWLGLTDGKLANWNSPRPTRRKPGRQRKYSNHAIETTVTLGLVFGLASRQTEGFLRSLLTLLNLDNDVPDHSTISRRKARLGQGASYERRTVKPVHLLIDSSGLSVHVGQLRTPPKARDYRKLHLAVDEHTSDVVACELTSKRARDASRVASLVGQIERPIASAKADAAYDTGDV